MRAVFATLSSLIARDGRAAMVTILEAHGSVPREAGARMVIDVEGGFHGTIGGGTLEWRMLAEAQRALETAKAGFDTRSLPLGPELGQCCGGRVTVSVEVFDAEDLGWMQPLLDLEAHGPVSTIARLVDRRMARHVVDGAGDAAIRYVAATQELHETFGARLRPLSVFGAGHVGRALILQGAQLPFNVTWVDPRPDAFPAAVPRAVTLITDPLTALAAAPAGAFIVVLTHSHALDLEIVDAALRAGRFPYVGLIGSMTKRARFERQMRDGGLATEVITQLVCPIGLPAIRSKLPAVIAASTLADLITRDEALAALKEPARQQTFRKVAG